MTATTRRRLVAGIAAFALLLIGIAAFLLTRNSGDSTIDASVAWFVNPAIAGELDVGQLRRTVTDGAEDALGVRLTLVDVDESFLARAYARRDEIADEAGLAAAAAHVADLQSRMVASEAAADALLDEIDQADRDVAELLVRVSDRVAAEHPLVPLDPAVAGALELTPAARFGAARLDPDESWVVVPTGTAFLLYDGDAVMRMQAIANAVLQGLGTIAGLPLRDGDPDEAMTAAIDTAADEHRARDAAVVRFTPDERDTIRRYLAGE